MALFDLAGVVATGRQLAAQARAGADTFAVLRTTDAAGGEGGASGTEATGDTGECLLTPGATRPEERVIADAAGSQAPYVVRALPWDIDLKASDVLLINGTRRMEVLGVLKAGAANVVVTAVCEERT